MNREPTIAPAHTEPKAHGLHDGFEGRSPQSPAVLEAAIASSLVVLDANVLLSLYRFSQTAREDMLKVCRALGDRLWVPHQAAQEFWRNRLSVMDSRDNAADEARQLLGKYRNNAHSAIENWARRAVIDDAKRDSMQAVLDEAFEKVHEQIVADSDEGLKATYDVKTDEVLVSLEVILDGKVGAKPDDDEFRLLVAEGRRRVENSEPPGYLDAEKADGDLDEGPAGDYLVWAQAVAEAERRESDLLLVTGDEKEDWWWKHRSHFLGPRHELAAEMLSTTGKRLTMMRPADLIQYAKAIQVYISDASVAEVSRVGATTSGSWSRRGITELLQRLDDEGAVQGEVIREAAREGGLIERARIYEIAGYDQTRMLRGFSRPCARITRDLQDEGIVDEGVEPMLSPVYGGGVTATDFEIPLEVVQILSEADPS